MSLRSVLRFTIGICTILPLIPLAAQAQAAERVYLLAADTGHLYYSVDASDPEASVSTIRRRCPALTGIPIPTHPCLSGLNIAGRHHIHSLFWMPGALFDAPASWSAANPLRFHLELDVDTEVEHTVHLGLQKGAHQVESPPATEISPGVWEGTLPTGGPLGSPDSVDDLIYVRVRTPAPSIVVTMRSAGASYLELPHPAKASGVPQLLREHTYRPDPSSFATSQRKFWFNDGAWDVDSFEGDLTVSRRFETQLSRRAEMVIAWVEAFKTPFVHDIVTGGQPDVRKVTNTPVISLLRDGEEIAQGGNNGATGRGEDALAVTAVDAGPLTLEVRPPQLGDHSYPYTAHVLVVYGARTLERMRWSFQIDHEGQLPVFRTPAGVSCPGRYEVVPTTAATTTFSLDLDWDTEAAGLPRYTIGFSLPTAGSFGCAQTGSGDRMRITIPGQRVWNVGAALAPGTTFVSWHDTVFEMDVRYAYRPPSAA